MRPCILETRKYENGIRMINRDTVAIILIVLMTVESLPLTSDVCSYQKDKKESPGVSRGPWRSSENRPRSPAHSSPPATLVSQDYGREYDNRFVFHWIFF